MLIPDGAGWHGATALDLPDNLSRLTLPPYSLELNPVENVRACLRANRRAITGFDSYDAIVDTCCQTWNFFANDPHTIASITSRPLQRSVERAVGITLRLDQLHEVAAGIVEDCHADRPRMHRVARECDAKTTQSFELKVQIVDLERRERDSSCDKSVPSGCSFDTTVSQ